MSTSPESELRAMWNERRPRTLDQLESMSSALGITYADRDVEALAADRVTISVYRSGQEIIGIFVENPDAHVSLLIRSDLAQSLFALLSAPTQEAYLSGTMI